jgi:hypothetical protein
MIVLGVPTALAASVLAVRSPGQGGWGMAALTISLTETVGLLVLLLHEMRVL